MSEVFSHNAAERRYELAVDGHIAHADYHLDGESIVFTHTLTPPALRGRGVGARLAHAALTDAKARGLKIVPACSFIADYLVKHPRFAS